MESSAYNPARLARLPIAVIKRYILGIDKVSFFCAENPAATKPLGACPRIQHVPCAWRCDAPKNDTGACDRSTFSNKPICIFGAEFTPVSYAWNLLDCFTSITLNTREEQAHTYKERIIYGRKNLIITLRIIGISCLIFSVNISRRKFIGFIIF